MKWIILVMGLLVLTSCKSDLLEVSEEDNTPTYISLEDLIEEEEPKYINATVYKCDSSLFYKKDGIILTNIYSGSNLNRRMDWQYIAIEMEYICVENMTKEEKDCIVGYNSLMDYTIGDIHINYFKEDFFVDEYGNKINCETKCKIEQDCEIIILDGDQDIFNVRETKNCTPPIKKCWGDDR